jgi:hypothetical protein
MTKKHLILALSLVLSLLPASNAQAADPCLAQFPDSSWSKGEPPAVAQLLNRDLVRTKKIVVRNSDKKELRSSIPNYGINDITPKYLNNTQVDYIWKRDFKQVTYPVTVTYEYQGSSCGVRIVSLTSGSITYKPYNSIEISDVAGIQSAFKSQTNDDFILTQKKVDQIGILAKYLESTKNSPIKITSNNITQDSSFGWWLGLEKYTYPFPFGYAALQITSEDNCLMNEDSKTSKNIAEMLEKMSPIEKSFYQRPLYGFFDKIAFSQGSTTCRLTVSFPIESILMYQNGIDFVRVNASVWVANGLPISATSGNAQAPKPVKSSITCIKGKLSKKITAVNPKCPAGFKLKK